MDASSLASRLSPPDLHFGFGEPVMLAFFEPVQ
jgi:hypothetical protein